MKKKEHTEDELVTAPVIEFKDREALNKVARKYNLRCSEAYKLLIELESILTKNRRLLSPDELKDFAKDLVKKGGKRSTE